MHCRIESLNAFKLGRQQCSKIVKVGGGYNLQGSKASIERLTRLVLLIAIASAL
jgi:hypothetical protein